MESDKLLDQILERFIDLIWDVNRGGAGARWPMPYVTDKFEDSLYCDADVLNRFDYLITALEKNGYTSKEIARLFRYPSIPARLLFLFRSKIFLNKPPSEQVRLAKKVAAYCYLLYYTNHFCQEGNNILYSQEEVTRRVDLHSFKELDNEVRKLLGQIEGKLWSYTELVFPRWHNLGHEFHGPYGYNGQLLLIKEWHDLDADLWSFSRSFKYNKIVCYHLFRDVKVSLDIHNRFFSEKPFIGNVEKSYIEIDGRIVNDSNALKILNNEIDELIKKGIVEVSKLGKKELLWKNAEVEFYTMKKLSETMGIDWKPPADCYNKITALQLPDEAKKYLETFRKVKQDKEMIRRIYDPREPMLEIDE